VRRRQPAKPLACILGALLFLSWPSWAATLDTLQAAIDGQEYGDAAEQSQTYLKDHPGNRDARFIHARALAGMGNTDGAISAFEALAEDFPLRPEPANNLAVLYAEKGDYDRARKWLDKALATQPAYATAHRNLGDVYTALADLAYKRALSSDVATTNVPLTMLDRLYYAQESVAPGDPKAPAPIPPKPKPASAEPPPAEPPAAEAAPEPKPAPEPEPKPEPEPPLAPSDDSRSLIQTVRSWALAWSSQDYDTYTDFYADDFDPGDGMNRSQWLALRQARLARPDKINIRIENPRITRLSANRAQIDFVQLYESPRYSDQVDKRLVLQHTRAGWRIVRETSATN